MRWFKTGWEICRCSPFDWKTRFLIPSSVKIRFYYIILKMSAFNGFIRIIIKSQGRNARDFWVLEEIVHLVGIFVQEHVLSLRNVFNYYYQILKINGHKHKIENIYTRYSCQNWIGKFHPIKNFYLQYFV